jgi:hypothetical protein
MENLERRIYRSEQRMRLARRPEWAHAWCGAFLRNVSARNARRSVAEVRQLETSKGLR